MSGLAERHTVQRVGPPPWRQGAHHGAGKGIDWAVEGRSTFDALGERGRPCRPDRAPRLATEESHAGDVPSQAAEVTRRPAAARMFPLPGQETPAASGLEAVAHTRLGEQVAGT